MLNGIPVSSRKPAPDDVRAYKTPRAAFNQYRSREFEAADAEGGWTFRPAPYAAFLAGWNAHRAAHADLSGEAREFVEAARVVERRLIPLLSGTLRDIDHADFIAFFTALAKLTQEKP